MNRYPILLIVFLLSSVLNASPCSMAKIDATGNFLETVSAEINMDGPKNSFEFDSGELGAEIVGVTWVAKSIES